MSLKTPSGESAVFLRESPHFRIVAAGSSERVFLAQNNEQQINIKQTSTIKDLLSVWLLMAERDWPLRSAAPSASPVRAPVFYRNLPEQTGEHGFQQKPIQKVVAFFLHRSLNISGCFWEDISLAAVMSRLCCHWLDGKLLRHTLYHCIYNSSHNISYTNTIPATL